MVVYTSVEGSSHILAKTSSDVLFATGMLVDKFLHIVQDTFDQDPLFILLVDKVLVLIPREHREIFNLGAILQLLLDSHDLLFLHLDFTLRNFVCGESLQVVCQSGEREQLDQPLGRIILVVNNSVAVVLRELVVEVVIAFTHGNKGSNPMVARGMMVIKGILTEVMGQAVDAEGSVVDKAETKHASVVETALNRVQLSSVSAASGAKISGRKKKQKTYSEITPTQTSDEHREQETHNQSKVRVVLVLEGNDRVGFQVGNVSVTDTVLWALNKHPSKVREEETTMSTVGVLIGVGPSN